MADRPERTPEGLRIRRQSTSTLATDDDTKIMLANRAAHFYSSDVSDRSAEQDMRIQRYAKFRGWSEPKDWPWPEASNLGITDIMQHSLRVQDTLHNAVMSARPPVAAKAHDKGNKEREREVDLLLDYQVFIEQGPSGEGERVIGELIEQFVNDGHFTAMIPWVKEMRDAVDRRTYPPIAEQSNQPAVYFQTILQEAFPNAALAPNVDGWDWRIKAADGEDIEASFYTDDEDQVELIIKRKVERFNGPKILPLTWDQVLYPTRAANLQIPGPSNPNGSGHVIIVDNPVLDEIKNLRRSGFYDLLSDEDIDAMASGGNSQGKDDSTDARDAMVDDLAGRATTSPVATQNNQHEVQRTLTRLLVFDIVDIEGNGQAEDVVYWVIWETQMVCRVRRLTEQYPSNPPRRPLAEAQFLPVEKRRAGIGLIEMVEGLHDAIKTLFDQTIDAGSIRNAPIFFYRSTGATRNEVIRWSPGEGYPLPDPKNDIHIPSFGQGGAAEAINLITMLTTQQERTTMQSDLAFGQVPRGGASALRTIGGMAMVNNHLEARPERVLRRFFLGLAEIYRQFHVLNQHMLPEEKKILIRGNLRDGKDPYQQIIKRGQIKGDFLFEFSANAFNASRVAFQQSIDQAVSMFINPLMLQMGMIDAQGIYRLARDWADTRGIEPDRYLKPPTVRANIQDILAEEALQTIQQGQRPDGYPAEIGGANEHLEKLMEFAGSDELGHLEGVQVQLFGEWLNKVRGFVQQEQLQAAAAQFGPPGQQGGGQGGGQARPGEPPVQTNELLNESLPGAGGGANTGVG